MSRTVLCFGELLWDLFPSGRELGGAPSNFAYRMAGFGHRTELASRVGKDDMGRDALDLLASKGVNTRFIQIDPDRPTGTVNVMLNSRGEPDFVINRDVAYDAIEWTEELGNFAANADCVCFGTLAQRCAASRGTLYRLLDAGKSAMKVLDINLRKDCYSSETVRRSLERADILKLNESEVTELGRMFDLPGAPERFASTVVHQFGLSHCVITLGANGVLGFGRESMRDWVHYRAPGFPVTVQDTCGAGDAFTAGFVHKLLSGGSLAESCNYGNALGALVSGTKGGMSPVSPEQIEEFMNTPPPLPER